MTFQLIVDTPMVLAMSAHELALSNLQRVGVGLVCFCSTKPSICPSLIGAYQSQSTQLRQRGTSGVQGPAHHILSLRDV